MTLVSKWRWEIIEHISGLVEGTHMEIFTCVFEYVMGRYGSQDPIGMLGLSQGALNSSRFFGTCQGVLLQLLRCVFESVFGYIKR